MRKPAPAFLRSFLLLSLIAGLLATLPFLAGLPGDFVLDDVPNIVNNETIQMKEWDAQKLLDIATAPQLSGSLRVLPTLTFAIDYWRSGGADPAAFKITNIAIHAVTACALAWLFLGLLTAAHTPERAARWAALALALAWALHPLQVSSVLYAVQRMQTLGTLFLVLALGAYLKARQSQISGRPSRTGFLASILLWVIAMGCKEDSVLLPAYTLALELTVLGFAHHSPTTSARLKLAYGIATATGVALYIFWVLPSNWHWDAYPARDFSSPERLLTQARVLCLYLWQIVIPIPSHMPFYYDWLEPSRGLLTPWTTLPAIITLAGLATLAWRLRNSAPLFSLGVAIFFCAHFITSNIIGLELAFEHRNSFALIGVVLAVGDVLMRIGKRLRLIPSVQAGISAALLCVLAMTAAARASDWRNAPTFAAASTQIAPHSGRAWFGLCIYQLESGGGAVASNKNLGNAISTCETGAHAAPKALNSLATLIILKATEHKDTTKDWLIFHERLKTVPMTWENQRAPMTFIYYARKGIALDKRQMMNAFSELTHRVDIGGFNNASIGYFMMNDLKDPDAAMPYFMRALNEANPLDPFPQQLATDLRTKQRPDLAEKVESIWKARFDSAP